MRRLLFILLVLSIGFPAGDSIACRMWGMTVDPDAGLQYPDSVFRWSLELTAEQNWGAAGWDGWSVCHVPRSGPVTVHRSRTMPWDDEHGGWVLDGPQGNLYPVLADTASLAMVHFRLASSGAVDDPNPHPFLYTVDGRTYAYQHNGGVTGTHWAEVMRRSVIGEAWLQLPLFAERPYMDLSRPERLVDSAFLAVLYMKQILIARSYGEGIQSVPARVAEEMYRTAGRAGSRLDFNSINGLLTDSDTLWAVVIAPDTDYNLWTQPFPASTDTAGSAVVLNFRPDETWRPVRELG
ncbi:hypothetical protein GF324_08690, partial [bacterium]|nr:hypothetical protein [bacterium]